MAKPLYNPVESLQHKMLQSAKTPPRSPGVLRTVTVADGKIHALFDPETNVVMPMPLNQVPAKKE